MSYFEVSNLTKAFGGLKAVDNLSFALNKHEIFSIIGPNGAGKSTLFNCINGQYDPDSGKVQYKGTDITGWNPNRIAEMGIGRTFQNIELFSRMTTMDNLMLGRHLNMTTGLLSASIMYFRKTAAAKEEIEHRKKVERIIDFLELESARDKPVSDLPYGTRKMVELGRALCMEPELLLLDEPAAGLNNEEQQDLIYWIGDIRDEFEITVMMIEHNMKLVMDISDRILAINFGKKLVEGDSDKVVNHPDVEKAYLG